MGKQKKSDIIIYIIGGKSHNTVSLVLADGGRGGGGHT